MSQTDIRKFKKILIANRGEIAVRIIRTCRDMGIISVAVYSEADRDSLHRLIADESICIGPAKASESYLNIDAVITAAKITCADAIHPGYGFLSERADFAKKCEENGIAFIGPSYDSLVLMGDKVTAKDTAKRSGAPVIPGSEGLVTSNEEARALCRDIGYPVMIKASCGGGGKGIRMVEGEDELERALANARAEAKANFGEDGVYIEKCIVDPRHIEVQIIADMAGNTCHLFERDCSMQRRHQKIIEEAPSPYLDDELRRSMGECAVKIAKEAGYYNAGTVEFLVTKEKDGTKRFYFMEMNTRVQVEHPVTETVTGIDIIRTQIEIAEGKALPFVQDDIKLRCHAIECRINAEDPLRAFAPCPGVIDELNMPGGIGVRVDSAVYQGYLVPPYYDSMIAKIIVSGSDRKEAIVRMRRALAELIFSGVTTNADFEALLLSGDVFSSGDYTSEYLDKLDIKKFIEG